MAAGYGRAAASDNSVSMLETATANLLPGAIVAFAVYVLLCVVSDAIVYFNRRQIFIRERGFEFLLFTSAVSIYGFATLAMVDALPNDEFNCKALKWPIGVIFLPLYLGSLIMRAVKLYLSFAVASEQMKVEGQPDIAVRQVFLLRHKWILSKWFFYSCVTSLTAIFIIVAIIINFYWDTTNGFTPDVNRYGVCLGPMIYNMGIQAICFSAILLAVTFLLLNTRITFLAKEEYGMLLCTIIPLFILWGVMQYFDYGSFYTFREVHALLMIIFAVQLITLGFPLFILWTYRHVDTVAIGGQEVYADQASLASLFRKCLSIPELRESFKDFVVECLCSENLIFYIRASAYEQLIPSKRAAEAISMRDLFIASNASFEINIDYNTRETILRNIELNHIDEDLFANAKYMVLEQLLQDPFKRWIRSAEFRRLWERVNSNQHLRKWTLRWIRRATTPDHGRLSSASSLASFASGSDDINHPNAFQLTSIYAPYGRKESLDSEADARSRVSSSASGHQSNGTYTSSGPDDASTTSKRSGPPSPDPISLNPNLIITRRPINALGPILEDDYDQQKDQAYQHQLALSRTSLSPNAQAIPPRKSSLSSSAPSNNSYHSSNGSPNSGSDVAKSSAAIATTATAAAVYSTSAASHDTKSSTSSSSFVNPPKARHLQTKPPTILINTSSSSPEPIKTEAAPEPVEEPAAVSATSAPKSVEVQAENQTVSASSLQALLSQTSTQRDSQPDTPTTGDDQTTLSHASSITIDPEKVMAGIMRDPMFAQRSSRTSFQSTTDSSTKDMSPHKGSPSSSPQFSSLTRSSGSGIFGLLSRSTPPGSVSRGSSSNLTALLASGGVKSTPPQSLSRKRGAAAAAAMASRPKDIPLSSSYDASDYVLRNDDQNGETSGPTGVASSHNPNDDDGNSESADGGRAVVETKAVPEVDGGARSHQDVIDTALNEILASLQKSLV